MATITLSPKQFLQPTRLEGLVNKQLETNLQLVNLFDTVPQDETTVTYLQDLTTAGEDYENAVTSKPFELGELSGLPEIEISPVTQKSGMLQPFGFKLAVSKRDINKGSVIDDLSRSVFRATYVMARYMDDKLIDALQGVTNDISEQSGAAVWSSDDATIASDIINFQKAFDLDGYKTKLTDLFVHKDNFYEAKEYYSSLIIANTGNPKDTSDFQDQDIIDTGLGTMLHRARSAKIAEGGYIGLDTRPGFKPITIHAYRDPDAKADSTFPLVNVFQYNEQEYPHRIITEFVSDIFPALKLPNSACYKSSGI
jgi:hypothetical protein